MTQVAFKEKGGLTLGDIFFCILEDSEKDDIHSDPLGYSAIFRSPGAALHFIKTTHLPSPKVVVLTYIGEGSFDLRKME